MDDFLRPAIISQHTGSPFALVPLFESGNVLVKSLSVLIAHCPRHSWQKTESLRNPPLTTYYTPWLCRIVAGHRNENRAPHFPSTKQVC